MKKLIKLLAIFIASTPVMLNVTACSNEPNWNNIPIPPPQIPIEVTGFQGVDFATMNIKDYDTVASLFSAIKNKLQDSPWKDKTATTWTGTKDGKVIADLNASDLKRNAQYTFEIKSNITLPGDAKFIITITSSHHIADNISVTNLNQIDDTNDKTILIACVFKNMNLVSKINEIADEYLNHIAIKTDGKPNYDRPVTGTATLTNPTSAKQEPYFYGSITVNFTVKLKKSPKNPTDLKSVIKVPDLGIIPDNRPYTILMYVIIKNFVTQLDLLAEIVNNLNITNPTKDSAELSGVKDSEYYSGHITLKFQISK
ncbi:hypothetical protein [Spiroplasma endosymbiont of Virgichneumon dumeticola]|uniref:hypothetical protein n=1 Tax=Spiroplasma endosymbiont of Virgichneumon dumeticola TaxID=3139323 RepID=UPI0035C9266C